MTAVNEPDLAFDAVVRAIDLGLPAANGDLPLDDVVTALARSLGKAQLALDADLPSVDTDALEAGVLPPCYQITESTVDLSLVLSFPDTGGGLREARASYPGAATPGAVSTVRVVLRPVAPVGLSVPAPDPATLPPTRVMAD
jgi:hypothetical protein